MKINQQILDYIQTFVLSLAHLFTLCLSHGRYSDVFISNFVHDMHAKNRRDYELIIIIKISNCSTDHCE